jgi:hypothetical protein
MLSKSAQSGYPRYLPSLILSFLLLFLPLAAAIERHYPRLWQERLILPDIIPDISRHTPLHYTGTFLPPVISRDRNLTPENNPVILSHLTRVPSGVTLTLAPGTQIYAHEFAGLNIEGNLIAAGNAVKPIVFTTNEEHPRNQLWNGISLEPGSRAELLFVAIQHASPAITCLADSRLNASNININVASTGIFSLSPNCNFRDSVLTHVRHGIVTSYPLSQLNNMDISASRQAIFNFSF